MSDRLNDNAADMYVHELARVDKLGPNRRLVFTLPDLAYPGYQNVQIKLILPAEYIPTLITLLASCDGVALNDKSSLAVLQCFVPGDTVN
jgi:hypothetical protein